MTLHQLRGALRSLTTAACLTAASLPWAPTAGAHVPFDERCAADSASSASRTPSWGALAAGTALTAAGAWGGGSGWGRRLDRETRHMMYARHGRKGAALASDIIEFVPLAGLVALEPAGVPARHNMKQRLALGVTGVAITEIIVQSTKRLVRRERPDGSDSHSWPSGHTALAFAGAEMCRMEYGNAWGAGAYGVAVLTGWLRLRADRHWLTDIAAGAGIGILSAQAAAALLPLESRWLGLDSRKGAMVMVPYASPEGAGLAAAIIF